MIAILNAGGGRVVSNRNTAANLTKTKKSTNGKGGFGGPDGKKHTSDVPQGVSCKKRSIRKCSIKDGDLLYFLRSISSTCFGRTWQWPCVVIKIGGGVGNGRDVRTDTERVLRWALIQDGALLSDWRRRAV